MQHALQVRVKFGTKTNFRYIHHDPRSHICYCYSPKDRCLASSTSSTVKYEPVLSIIALNLRSPGIIIKSY